MNRFKKVWVAAFLCWSIVQAGCGSVSPQEEQSRSAGAPAISCIGVLPAETFIDYDGTLSPAQAKSLKTGAHALSSLLNQQLTAHSGVHFLSEEQLQGLSEVLPADPLVLARLAGNHLGCNAILETTLYRYDERVGTKYSVEAPASVFFKYRLIDVDKGGVLCRGESNETQQTVMENLLQLNKASERNFTWITAEELLREGLTDLFNDCHYLQDQKQ